MRPSDYPEVAPSVVGWKIILTAHSTSPGAVHRALPRGEGATRARGRGFTLVELLTVVAIVGILAVIALASFRKQTGGSRSGEAFAMIQSIRAAEERHRAENLTYLDVSRSGQWFPDDPKGRSPRTQRSFYSPAHADYGTWMTLNPAVIGPVEFGYLVNAGPPTTPMTPPAVSQTGFAWPAAGDHWFVIQASADADGNGVVAFFMASSIRADVYHQNDGE